MAPKKTEVDETKCDLTKFMEQAPAPVRIETLQVNRQRPAIARLGHLIQVTHDGVACSMKGGGTEMRLKKGGHDN